MNFKNILIPLLFISLDVVAVGSCSNNFGHGQPVYELTAIFDLNGTWYYGSFNEDETIIYLPTDLPTKYNDQPVQYWYYFSDEEKKEITFPFECSEVSPTDYYRGHRNSYVFLPFIDEVNEQS